MDKASGAVVAARQAGRVDGAALMVGGGSPVPLVAVIVEDGAAPVNAEFRIEPAGYSRLWQGRPHGLASHH